MSRIEKQWLFFDRTDICTGTTHYYFDENRISEESRKKAEELHDFWSFCMNIGKKHGMKPLRVPSGVKFVAEKAKVTRPLFDLDKPWELVSNGGKLGYVSGDFDEEDQLYKIWYSLSGHTFFAYSSDLKDWVKPELDVWEFEGQKTNAINLCVSEGCVFLDPLHPETGKYKAVNIKQTEGNTPTDRVSLMVYSSSDGIHFNEMDITPLHYFFDTQNNIFYDELLGKYVAYLRGHYNGRAIQRTEADDLRNMPFPEILFFSDNEDPLDADYYNNACSPYPYDKRYRIMLPSIYCHGADQIYIRMAHSRNGRQFQWTSREPVIEGIDEEGTTFENFYASPHMFKLLYGGKESVGVYMRTTGNLHNEGYFSGLYEQYEETNRGIRMAVWEKDRLAGLKADETGEFYLQIRLQKGQTIEVNAKLRGQGELSYEIVTQREDLPIPGFEINHSVALHGDIAWRPLEWENSPSLPDTIGERDVFLHIRLDHGTIYGIRIVNPYTEDYVEHQTENERIVSALLEHK